MSDLTQTLNENFKISFQKLVEKHVEVSGKPQGPKDVLIRVDPPYSKIGIILIFSLRKEPHCTSFFVFCGNLKMYLQLRGANRPSWGESNPGGVHQDACF